eukprot:3683619-Prymnesium_polylepis.1
MDGRRAERRHQHTARGQHHALVRISQRLEQSHAEHVAIGACHSGGEGLREGRRDAGCVTPFPNMAGTTATNIVGAAISVWQSPLPLI